MHKNLMETFRKCLFFHCTYETNLGKQNIVCFIIICWEDKIERHSEMERQQAVTECLFLRYLGFLEAYRRWEMGGGP